MHSMSEKEPENSKKGDNLFDNLHNVLVKPNRKSDNDVANAHPKIAKALDFLNKKNSFIENTGEKKHKESLEARIRELEQKLAEQRPEDLSLLQKIAQEAKRKDNKAENDREEEADRCIIPEGPNPEEVGTWRKIQIKKNDLSYGKTNF